jgi:hypothetical protein
MLRLIPHTALGSVLMAGLLSPATPPAADCAAFTAVWQPSLQAQARLAQPKPLVTQPKPSRSALQQRTQSWREWQQQNHQLETQRLAQLQALPLEDSQLSDWRSAFVSWHQQTQQANAALQTALQTRQPQQIQQAGNRIYQLNRTKNGLYEQADRLCPATV